MRPTKMGDGAEILSLWRLPKEEFNEWRRINDLPDLLGFFKTLPRFSEWQTEQEFEDADILSVDHTSHLFVGEHVRYLVDLTQPTNAIGRTERLVSIFLSQPIPLGSTIIHSFRPFAPYFDWLKRKQGTPYFRI